VSVVVFAHAGHWLPQLLYLAPVAVLIVAVLVGRVRDRRSGRTRGHGDDTDWRAGASARQPRRARMRRDG
jgi:hypothetical protein